MNILFNNKLYEHGDTYLQNNHIKSNLKAFEHKFQQEWGRLKTTKGCPKTWGPMAGDILLDEVDASTTEMHVIGPKTLKDAVKPKNKGKKKASSVI